MAVHKVNYGFQRHAAASVATLQVLTVLRVLVPSNASGMQPAYSWKQVSGEYDA